MTERRLTGRIVARLSVEVDQTKLEKVILETAAGKPYTDATRDEMVRAVLASDAVKTVVETQFIPEETKS